MSLLSYLVSLSDAEWKHVLKTVPEVYRAPGGQALPDWGEWVAARDAAGAARRKARHRTRSHRPLTC